jgi:hypothetical protein
LRFVPKILNQDIARYCPLLPVIARAHALDRQTPEMEAENLMFERRKESQSRQLVTATSTIMPYSTTA